MNRSVNANQIFKETADAINVLLDQGMRMSMDLLESFDRVRASLKSDLTHQSGAFQTGGSLRFGSSCNCAIPPPCWMPVSLGELTTFVCPGGTATLRVRVTNCGNQQRQIRVDTKQTETAIGVTPASLDLGPMERGVFTLTGLTAANTGTGQEFESLIWVRGCKDYYLRWTIKVANRGVDCCHEITVEDCPDLIHHWYDHFYCARSCPSHGRVGNAG